MSVRELPCPGGDLGPFDTQEILAVHTRWTGRVALPSHSYVFGAFAIDGFMVFTTANSFHGFE